MRPSRFLRAQGFAFRRIAQIGAHDEALEFPAIQGELVGRPLRHESAALHHQDFVKEPQKMQAMKMMSLENFHLLD